MPLLQYRMNLVYCIEQYVIVVKLLEQHFELKLPKGKGHPRTGHEGSEGE
jgi:hypothetical protein